MAFAANPFLSESDRKQFRRERTLFLAAISSGTILNPLNSSIISMALHDIQTTFVISFATTSWVISVYYIASAIGQPVMGRLSDLVGKRTIFLAGLAVATLAVCGAPFISSFSSLLLLRILQAIGTSAIFPSGMGMIREHIFYKQAYAVSVISVFNSVTVAIGPTIGGFAISYGGWLAIFMTNVPFLLVSFLLAWFVLPKEDHDIPAKRKETDFDFPGILLFTATFVFLLLFLLSLKSNVNYVYGLLGVAALFFFIKREATMPNPFIDVRLFQTNKALRSINCMFVLLNIYNYALLFGLPTFFVQRMGADIKVIGLLMFFIAGFSIVISPITGKWIDASGTDIPLLVGSLLLLVGAFLVTLCFSFVTLFWCIPILSLIGLGYGLLNVSLQAAMLQAAPTEKIGIASGLFQTSRYIGAIFSSLLLAMITSESGNEIPVHLFGGILVSIAVISTIMSFRIHKR